MSKEPLVKQIDTRIELLDFTYTTKQRILRDAGGAPLLEADESWGPDDLRAIANILSKAADIMEATND